MSTAVSLPPVSPVSPVSPASKASKASKASPLAPSASGGPAAPRAGRSFPARSTLTAADRKVVRAMAEAMFSQDGEVEASRLEAHLTEVDHYLSAASKPIRLGLRLALLVVRLAPILMFFRLRPLERLPVDERVELLSRLERSRLAALSLAFIGWRTIMTLVFYEDPAELRSLGYAGEERLRHKRRLPALMLAPQPGAAPELAPAPPALAPAPPAEESGVRLRGNRGNASEEAQEEAPDRSEVA